MRKLTRTLVAAALLALVGCTSTTQPTQDQINQQIQTVVAGQLCVQQQEVQACGPTAVSVLPAVIAGGAGAAVAGTAVGACALLHLPTANAACGVFGTPIPTPTPH